MAGSDRHDTPRDSRGPSRSGASGAEGREALGVLDDDAFVRALLGPLDDDHPAAPEALTDRTIRKVQAELTSRDLIDLTTFVFLMRFCAPLLDLLAAFFGHDPLSPPESMSAPRTTRPADPRRDRDE